MDFLNPPIERFPKNEEQLVDAIRNAWKRVGLTEIGQRLPGKLLQDYVPWKLPPITNLPTKLRLWLIIYDEFVDWFCALYVCCEMSLFADADRDKLQQNESLKAISLLSSRVISDLFGIRNLVCCGLEPGARTLLRSTREHIDVISLILIDSSCASSFMATNSPESSNAFWHKYLSKDRIRKVIRRYLGDDLSEHFEMREGRDKIYGASVHPSQYICGLAMFSPEAQSHPDRGHIGVGIPTAISCNTLTDAAISILEVGLVLRRQIFMSDDLGTSLFTPQMHDEFFRKIVREGPGVFLSILVTVHHDSLKSIFRDFVAEVEVPNQDQAK